MIGTYVPRALILGKILEVQTYTSFIVSHMYPSLANIL